MEQEKSPGAQRARGMHRENQYRVTQLGDSARYSVLLLPTESVPLVF